MLFATLLLLSAADAAPPPAIYAQPSISESSAATCLPASLLKQGKVVALSAYESSGPVMPFTLADSYNRPVRALTVTGHAKEPIILVVSAYEPVLWDLSAIKGRVKAVVASGQYPQVVRGLASSVPVRFSSVSEGRASQQCGKVRFVYRATSDIEAMAQDIKQAIGTYPRSFYGNYSADSFDVDGPDVAIEDSPKAEDVQSSAPITRQAEPDRSASGAFARPRPFASHGPKLRIVEWDEAGNITRNEGAPEDRPRPTMVRPPRYTPPPPSLYYTLSAFPFRWLFWAGVFAFGFYRWRRHQKLQAEAQVWEFEPSPPAVPGPVPAPAAPPAPEAESQIVELSSLAAITDSGTLVLAIHRYGREVQNLSRTKFDPDLADEIDTIVERHFNHAVARYRQVRASLEGAEAVRADETLQRAIDRLAGRLRELQAEQHIRDVDGVDEAARFIDARHPI